MKSLRKTAYMGLGWATWNVGKRATKRHIKRSGSPKLKIGAGLLIIAVIGAVIASKTGE